MAIVKSFGLPWIVRPFYFPFYEFPKHDKKKVFLHFPPRSPLESLTPCPPFQITRI